MDKVRLIALERAELEDIRALQALVYEHLERHTGQLLGAADVSGGLLSAPSPSLNNVTDALTFQSFAFGSLNAGQDSSDGTTRTPIARVIRFDSGVGGHIGYPVDTSLMQQGTTYSLFTRAVLIESDNEQRRQFSVATGLEESLVMNTRERERVEFALLLSTSSPVGSGWVKILNLVKDSNGDMISTPLSLWDDANSKAVTRLESRIPQIMLETSELIDNIARDNSHTLGLVEMLALIRGQLARVLHHGGEDNDPIASDTTERWTDRPANSLGYISTKLSTLENDLTQETTDRTTDINDLRRVKRVYARLYFRWTATANTFNVTLYDETGAASVKLDGSAIQATTFSVGDVGITAANFIKCSRRPILNFTTTDTWEILSHNVQPVLAAPYGLNEPFDSLASGSFDTLEPRAFSYALLSNPNALINDLPEGLITSEGVEPAPSTSAPSIIPRVITPFYDAGNITASAGSLGQAVPFVLSMDLVNSDNYSYVYDIMMTVRRA